MSHRFPAPWRVEPFERCFRIIDAAGRILAYVHWDERLSSLGDPMTRDEARRIAVNMAKLPELLQAKTPQR